MNVFHTKDTAEKFIKYEKNYTDCDDAVKSQFSKTVTMDGKDWNLITVKYKDVHGWNRFKLGLVTVFKTIATCGIKLFTSEKLRDNWISLWNAKKIRVLYDLNLPTRDKSPEPKSNECGNKPQDSHNEVRFTAPKEEPKKKPNHEPIVKLPKKPAIQLIQKTETPTIPIGKAEKKPELLTPSSLPTPVEKAPEQVQTQPEQKTETPAIPVENLEIIEKNLSPLSSNVPSNTEETKENSESTAQKVCGLREAITPKEKNQIKECESATTPPSPPLSKEELNGLNSKLVIERNALLQDFRNLIGRCSGDISTTTTTKLPKFVEEVFPNLPNMNPVKEMFDKLTDDVLINLLSECEDFISDDRHRQFLDELNKLIFVDWECYFKEFECTEEKLSNPEEMQKLQKKFLGELSSLMLKFFKESDEKIKKGFVEQAIFTEIAKETVTKAIVLQYMMFTNIPRLKFSTPTKGMPYDPVRCKTRKGSHNNILVYKWIKPGLISPFDNYVIAKVDVDTRRKTNKNPPKTNDLSLIRWDSSKSKDPIEQHQSIDSLRFKVLKDQKIPNDDLEKHKFLSEKNAELRNAIDLLKNHTYGACYSEEFDTPQVSSVKKKIDDICEIIKSYTEKYSNTDENKLLDHFNLLRSYSFDESKLALTRNKIEKYQAGVFKLEDVKSEFIENFIKDTEIKNFLEEDDFKALANVVFELYYAMSQGDVKIKFIIPDIGCAYNHNLFQTRNTQNHESIFVKKTFRPGIYSTFDNHVLIPADVSTMEAKA